MLPKEEIHFFNDIAYFHVPFTHCPTGQKTRTDLKCHCNPDDNFDWKGYSCKRTLKSVVLRDGLLTHDPIGTSKFFEINGMEKPEGWDQEGKD
jgi:alpha 1,2-mannosyltransferase